jgi:secondary thiamine-phosphate synthase enzyme
MKIFQKEITLKQRKRGFHLITDEVVQAVPELKGINVGFANILIKHTSASLSINENADPTVRRDMEKFFTDVVPEEINYYKHTHEGLDDMTAHIKASIIGCSLNVPVTKGRFNLGVWQGIYLCEHRNSSGERQIVVTLYGE